LKTYRSLKNNGFDPLIVGRKQKNTFFLKEINTRHFKLFFNSSFLFYAEFNIRLLCFLLFKKTDIITSNDLDTLPACFIASKLKKCGLVYDSHELYTEVPELYNRKRIKYIWEWIERMIVPRLSQNITVCQSIADIYHKKYQVKFNVIKNLPNKINEIDSTLQKEKIIIYQGVLNIGRGIELMMDSMKHLTDYKLIIAGSGDIEKQLLQKRINDKLEEQVVFLGRLDKKELDSYTRKAMVGFSLEENLGLNYYYALPNKIFDYIQSETPVIASALPEMEKMINKHKVGICIKDRTENNIADAVKKIETNYDQYLNACRKAKGYLHWENQEEKLISIYKETLVRNK